MFGISVQQQTYNYLALQKSCYKTLRQTDWFVISICFDLSWIINNLADAEVSGEAGFIP